MLLTTVDEFTFELFNLHRETLLFQQYAIRYFNSDKPKVMTYAAYTDSITTFRQTCHEVVEQVLSRPERRLLADSTKPLALDYINHRGERAMRYVAHGVLHYGEDSFYKSPCLTYRAFDMRKGAVRDFLVANIIGNVAIHHGA
jgi:hypothetical protein